jgi:hypothetical protein
VTGVTAGQWSAIDALEHMANELGPSVCRLTTWTTGLYDAQRAAALKENGNLVDVRMLLDRATFEKSPQFAGPLIDALGAQAFRCASVHSKVIIVEGADRIAVFRSSMNLNKNLRTEQFDVSVCADIGAFYRGWFDDLWHWAGETSDNERIIKAVFDRWDKTTNDDASFGSLMAGQWGL